MCMFIATKYEEVQPPDVGKDEDIDKGERDKKRKKTIEKKYSEVEELCKTKLIRMGSPNYIKLYVRRAYIMASSRVPWTVKT